MGNDNTNTTYPRIKPANKTLTSVGKAALDRENNPQKYQGSPDPRKDATGFAEWVKKMLGG